MEYVEIKENNELIKRINYFCKSILLNYKSWVVTSFALLFINNNILTSYISFAIMLFVVHIAHYVNHFDSSYPFNVVHLYHHNNNNMSSHLLQILLEFFSLLFILVLKYLIIFQYGVNVFPFINDWTIVFCYFFYTTVHNINYSIFHVNKIHEIHHKTYMKNIGPDISDIIFGTKLNPETDIENTDHYIFNVIVSALIVLCLKYLFNKNPILKYVFIIIYFVTMIILIYYTIKLFEKEMQYYFIDSLRNFVT